MNAVGTAASATLGCLTTFVCHTSDQEPSFELTPSRELEFQCATGTPTTASTVADEPTKRKTLHPTVTTRLAASLEHARQYRLKLGGLAKTSLLTRKCLLALLLVLAEKNIRTATAYITHSTTLRALMWPVLTFVATLLLFVALMSGRTSRPYAVLAFLTAHVGLLILTDVTTATGVPPMMSYVQTNSSGWSPMKSNVSLSDGLNRVYPHSSVLLSWHSAERSDVIVHNEPKCLPHGRTPFVAYLVRMASPGAHALIAVAISLIVSHHTASIASWTRLTGRGLTATAVRLVRCLDCCRHNSTLSSTASTVMLTLALRFIVSVRSSYEPAITMALETAGVWALAQTGLVAQVVVVFITYATYRHLPGSILARTPGTLTAADEIKMIGTHMSQTAVTVALPLGALLFLNHYLVTRPLKGSDYALVDPVGRVLPLLLLRGTWIAVPVTLRCCYAVDRYQKTLRLWSALVVTSVVRVVYLVDAAICAAAASSATSTLPVTDSIAAAVLWLRELRSVDRCALLLVIFNFIAVMMLTTKHMMSSAWIQWCVWLGWFTERFPQIAWCAGLALTTGLALELPLLLAVLVLLGYGAATYAAVQLHSSGVLAQHVFAGLKCVFIGVAVVISIIINKLPQVTLADITTAHMAVRVSSTNSTWYEKGYWYGTGMLSLAWNFGTFAATLINPPVGIAMMGVHTAASKVIAAGGVASTAAALSGLGV
jgi:hypothetical protein